MQRYQIVKQIGEGAFSRVFLAEKKETNQIVAIKQHKNQYKTWEEAVNLREVKVLMKIKHDSLIKLYEIIYEQTNLYMVFEYAEGNILDMFISNPQLPSGGNLTEKKIKSIIFQIACGLEKIHLSGYVHRDIKPENILVKGNQIKIADFGLIREYKIIGLFTQYVSTRWYRAPELIIEMKKYSCPVDIFALGCVMAELYNGKPLFPGENQLEQLILVFQKLQIPRKQEWPEFHRQCYKKGIQISYQPLEKQPRFIQREKHYKNAESLIEWMLKIHPNKRPTITEVLANTYFDEVRDKLKHLANFPIKKTEEKEKPQKNTGKKKFQIKSLSCASLAKIFSSSINKANEEEKKKVEKKKQEKIDRQKLGKSVSEPTLSKINCYRKRKFKFIQENKIDLKKSVKETEKRLKRERSEEQYLYYTKSKRNSFSKAQKSFRLHKSKEYKKQNSLSKYQSPYFM